MRDKRKFPRLDEKWKINYRVLEKEEFFKDPIRQFTMNISSGGLCFETEEEIVPDTMLALELESDISPSAILAISKVIWCKKAGLGYEIGAEFWWIGWQNDDAQKAVANYIASALKTKRESTEP